MFTMTKLNHDCHCKPPWRRSNLGFICHSLERRALGIAKGLVLGGIQYIFYLFWIPPPINHGGRMTRKKQILCFIPLEKGRRNDSLLNFTALHLCAFLLLFPFMAVAQEQASDIRGIKSLEHFSYSPLIYIVPSILLIILISYLIFYLIKRRKNKNPKINAEPEIPYYIQAVSQLEELQSNAKFDGKQEKKTHFLLSDILRLYLENQFYLNATDMTLEELELNLNNVHALSEKEKIAFLNILKETDKVKFAKMSLGEKAGLKLIADAIAFVNSSSVQFTNLNGS